MEKDVVITHENIADNIVLEDQYKFATLTTVGLDRLSDFYVRLEFIGLDEKGMQLLAKLFQIPQRFKIQSELIDKEGYNISHIIATDISASSMGSMIWECLSDDPENYIGRNDPWKSQIS